MRFSARIPGLLLVVALAACEGNVNDGSGFMTVFTARVSLTSAGGELNLGSGFQNPDFLYFLAAGTALPNGDNCSISGDGSRIAFVSAATNVVPGDTNGRPDIFLHDRTDGSVRIVSNTNLGNPSDNFNYLPAISADGRYVTYQSLASNLTEPTLEGNGQYDVYRWDSTTGLNQLVSVQADGVTAGSGQYPSISANGRYIAFSTSTSLDAGAVDGDASLDVYVRDMTLTACELVSTPTAGPKPPQNVYHPCVSPDGRYVAFNGDQALDPSYGTTGTLAVFLRDTQSDTTNLISLGDGPVAPNSDCENPSLSTDARYIAYHSKATNICVPDDNSGASDIYIYDRLNAITTRISVSAIPYQGNSDSADADISADGRFVTYASMSKNLTPPDSNLKQDVFVYDRSTGIPSRVSVRTYGEEAEDESLSPAISADGRWVVFSSRADNLVDDDLNGVGDVFVRGPLY